MQSLLNVIQMLLQKFVAQNALGWIEALIAKLKTAAWKKKVEEATEAVKEAGTNPELTPEQKAKEQEDAFAKLVDTVTRTK